MSAILTCLRISPSDRSFSLRLAFTNGKAVPTVYFITLCSSIAHIQLSLVLSLWRVLSSLRCEHLTFCRPEYSWLITSCSTVWWPQQLTLGFFHNETGVGQRYVAFWVALILFSPAVGQLSKYLKDARILCFVGFLLFAGASIGMLALPTSHTGEIASVAFITLAGAGFAFPFILLLSVAQWSAPGELL